MGYFNQSNKKDTFKDVDFYLKERDYGFGFRELSLVLGWIDCICLLRKNIDRIDLIEKELRDLKALRVKYRSHTNKKRLTDYNPLSILEESFPKLKTQKNIDSNIHKNDTRIKELENSLLFSPLAKIKISPRNLVLLVWGCAIKINRESIDWNLMENLFEWFRNDKKNTNLGSLFDSEKINKNTLENMYNKHMTEKKPNKEIEDLIGFIYKKSFIEKKLGTGITISKQNSEISAWK